MGESDFPSPSGLQHTSTTSCATKTNLNQYLYIYTYTSQYVRAGRRFNMYGLNNGLIYNIILYNKEILYFFYRKCTTSCIYTCMVKWITIIPLSKYWSCIWNEWDVIKDIRYFINLWEFDLQLQSTWILWWGVDREGRKGV